MTMLSLTRRVALLLALLPQLAVLGLGQGVVVCMTADGQMEVEAASSGCCAETTAMATSMSAALSAEESDADCGSCSDFGIVLDPRPCRGSGVEALQLSSDLATGLSLMSGTLDHVTGPPRGVAQATVCAAAPLHLAHLRSVLLSC